MGRDTIQLETAMSTIFQEYLLEFTSEYGISEDLHPELPAPGDRIVDFLEDKIGVYTKIFEFANFRIPILQFLFDILGYYQIHLSQLSVIGASKNNRFFWVDEKVFLTVIDWRESAPKDEKPAEGSYSVEDVARLDTRRTSIQKQPEALLCLVGLSRNTTLERPKMCILPPCAVADNHRKPGDRYGRAGRSHRVYGTSIPPIERSPMDFDNETPRNKINEGDGMEDKCFGDRGPEVPPYRTSSRPRGRSKKIKQEKMPPMCTLGEQKRRKRVNDEADANAPPKVLRKDFDVSRPIPDTSRKNPCLTGLEAAPPCLALPRKNRDKRYCESSKGATVAGDPDSEKSSSFTSFAGSPGGIYQPGWGITNSCRFDTPGACQDAVDHMVPPGYFSELRHLPNEEFLNQYNVNLARQVAMGSQLRLRFEQEVRLLKKAKEKVAKRDQRIHAREEEIKKLDQEVQGLRNQTRNLETLLEAEVDMKKAAEANSAELTRELESLRAKFADLQVNNNQLFQQVSTLEAQVTGEEQIKAAFEEFKKREEDKVERRCAEMDARLDALSIDFDEELYPHMLTANAGRRWAIGHALRLAVMKCVESTDLRWAFANVVSTGIAKGMMSVPTVAPQGLAILLTDASTLTETTKDEASPRLIRSKSLPPMYNLDWP
ncbi:hypothetical protein Tco_0526407 [Tanacetum coccineum]